MSWIRCKEAVIENPFLNNSVKLGKSGFIFRIARDRQLMKIARYYLLSLGVIFLDQLVKLLVHFYMDLGISGELIVINDWFRLHYLLNPGMAFGLQIEAEYGKMLLSIFRLLAIIGIGYYLYYQTKKGVHPGMSWSLALIFGGAIGNAIDSTFYGVLLNNAPPNVPTPWFHGQVIDMLYFPLIEGTFPHWMPVIGGDYFQFFRPVFNIADASIFIGVSIILIFQKRFLAKLQNREETTDMNGQQNDMDEPSDVDEDIVKKAV